MKTMLATIGAPVAWGTTYVSVTELLPADRPLLVAAMRVAPAGIVLVLAGRWTARRRPPRIEWRSTVALAMANFGVFFPLLVVAVYRLPGGVAAAAGGLQPLLVGALGWAVTGARPRGRDVAIGAVAAGGVAMVVLRPGAGFDLVGLAAAVGANVSFATGVVLTRHFGAPADRVTATGHQLLVSALVLVPLALTLEGAPPVPGARELAGYAYLSLVATALAFVLWFRGIERLPAGAPPLLGLASPATGAVAGWVVLGQALSPVQLAGFAVTLGAIASGARLRVPGDSGGTVTGMRTRRRRANDCDCSASAA